MSLLIIEEIKVYRVIYKKNRENKINLRKN